MKYLKKFNESVEIEDENLLLIEDFLLEYLEKWKLINEDKQISLIFSGEKAEYNGTYKIDPVSTNYFKTEGFPDGKSGYRVKICFSKEFDENEFKIDMSRFIRRIQKSGYNYDTYKQKYGEIFVKYYIAFFK